MSEMSEILSVCQNFFAPGQKCQKFMGSGWPGPIPVRNLSDFFACCQKSRAACQKFIRNVRNPDGHVVYVNRCGGSHLSPVPAPTPMS